jgi:hypothetical protein
VTRRFPLPARRSCFASSQPLSVQLITFLFRIKLQFPPFGIAGAFVSSVARFNKETRSEKVLEVIMKFQNMLRTQMVITGLGAALLFAGSAKAQEITNTEFSDGPYVTAFAQPAQPHSAQASPASTPVMTESQTMQTLASVGMPVLSDDGGTVASSEVERWIVAGLLFIALGIIMFYCAAELSALAELKRANRSLRARIAARMSPSAV